MSYPSVCSSAIIEIEETEQRGSAAVLLGQAENLIFWLTQIEVE
jgi:hypothetical protein